MNKYKCYEYYTFPTIINIPLDLFICLVGLLLVTIYYLHQRYKYIYRFTS